MRKYLLLRTSVRVADCSRSRDAFQEPRSFLSTLNDEPRSHALTCVLYDALGATLLAPALNATTRFRVVDDAAETDDGRRLIELSSTPRSRKGKRFKGNFTFGKDKKDEKKLLKR